MQLRHQLKAAHGTTSQDQATIAELRAAKSVGSSTTVAANAELRAVREAAEADTFRYQARVHELETIR